MNLFLSKKHCFMIFFLFLLVPSRVFPDEHLPYLKNKDVMVEMSDGVRLACDIYLPRGGGTFPVIFLRTPYDKNTLGAAVGAYFSQRGYAVVVQDCRGKFASEGNFLPIINEGKDAKETLDWIGNQPWCNQRIGYWGSSYSSYSGFYLGAIRHPLLKTMVNVAGAGDMNQFLYPGGTLHLMAALPWALFSEGKSRSSIANIDIRRLFFYVPLKEAFSSIRRTSDIWNMLADPELSGLLKERISISSKFSEINIPIFHIIGWNDMMYRSSLSVYRMIQQASSGKEKPPFQKIIIGPWHHDQQWTGKTVVGEEDFGPAARIDKQSILQMSLQWFDYWLKGKDSPIVEESPARIFIMGKNEWREASCFPLAATHSQCWYLSSKKGARSINGDGVLSFIQQKGGSDFDSYIFDPMDPVPTKGGVNFHFFRNNLGIMDQRSVEERKDVLVYTSDPFPQDVEIIGPIKVVLFVSTEGKDTDFTAKLVEVRKDGYARIIEDGILRLGYRNSRRKFEPVEPGRIYKITIDLGATAILLKRGHRLRLEVSSSNFPKYTRNPNTGENPLEASFFRKVRQKVFHNEKYPSHLILTVLNKE